MDEGIVGEMEELVLDGGQDAGHLLRRTSEVIDRKAPQRHGRDAQLGTPLDDLAELVGAEGVGGARIGEALLAGEASVAIEDDADMAWTRPLPHLAEEASLVEVVEEALHVFVEAMTE